MHKLKSIDISIPESTMRLEQSRAARVVAERSIDWCFATDVSFSDETGNVGLRLSDVAIFGFFIDLASAVRKLAEGATREHITDRYGEFDITLERLPSSKTVRMTISVAAEEVCFVDTLDGLREKLCQAVEQVDVGYTTAIPELLNYDEYTDTVAVIRHLLDCPATEEHPDGDTAGDIPPPQPVS